MLDDRLLKEFMFGFYGYGNYNADYWFIGMEEHIGKSVSRKNLEKKIAKKLKLWKERGCKPLEDLVYFNSQLGGNKNFDERAVLVKTWNRIIDVLLGIKGQKHKRTRVKEYQRNELARDKDCDSCLMELLPLPSPDVNAWPAYETCSRIPCLKSRDKYVGFVRPKRIARLKSEIETHHPKAVVFYGKGNWKYYRKVAGVKFHSTEMDGVKMGNNERTLFVMTKHLALREVRNKECYEIGRWISSRLVGLGR